MEDLTCRLTSIAFKLPHHLLLQSPCPSLLESPPTSESPRLRSTSSMAPPTFSVEQTAEAAAPEGQQPYRRSLPTPFLIKTYQIVDDPALDNIISWNEDGSTFIVWRQAELASEILPKLFKHNNFTSFLRQLNAYGFRKIVPERWEFGNKRFRRGQRHLLCDIHRRMVSADSPTLTTSAVTAIPVVAPTHSTEEHVLSSNSTLGMAVPREENENESERLRIENSMLEKIGLIGENERLMSENLMLKKIRLSSENSLLKMAFGLIEENERLRSENSKLKDDIGEMKGVCHRIMMLMSNYSASQQVGEVVSKLMSSELAFDEVEVPAGARLFGVAIGAKRAREEAGDERVVAVNSEAESSGAAGDEREVAGAADRSELGALKSSRDELAKRRRFGAGFCRSWPETNRLGLIYLSGFLKN